MTSSDSIAVCCRGLVKTYGAGDAQVRALRGVDLDIRFGELLLLVGPSGSGKTTLISIIAGIVEQTEGECLALKHNCRTMNAVDKAHFRGQSVGFVFQEFNLLPTLSAAENVAVPLLINGADRRAAMARAERVLTEVGLSDRADANVSKLSGGQKQRVAIARALVHGPKLIVCDEPTSNLDHAAGHQIMEILRNLAKSNERALVVVTHDTRVFEFADRITRLEDGMVVDSNASVSLS